MVACWGITWYLHWLAALVALLANVYFVLSLWFWWNLYPEKSERD